MIVGIVVTLFGIGAIVLGVLQLVGVLPSARRYGGAGGFSSSINLGVGILLIALGVLRLKGLF